MSESNSAVVRRGWLALISLVACLQLAGCAQAEKAPQAGRAELGPPSETLDPKYLFEVVRHVYRWYLDESDIDGLSGTKTFPFYVRRLSVPLDPGDKSEMAEITMPRVGTSVKVKRSDYAIPEMGVTVRSSTFKITQVSKVDVEKRPGPGDRVVNVDYGEMKEYLFKTRTEATYPEGAFLERLRLALRHELKLQPGEVEPGRQIVHLAPISPVANEVYAYWENRNLLIRFASDIDLDQPEVWEHETLMVRTWDAYRQAVVSLDEAAGSNAYLTRAQLGRALYNTVVLGRRLEVANPGGAAAP